MISCARSSPERGLGRRAGILDRRDFIGGSDARIIMGQDEKALIRLWQEKRGEVGREDLSTNLIVQLGLVTEDLNRQWYERNTSNALKDVQCRMKHPGHPVDAKG
jgi:predicted phage-related endonuclease